MIKLKDLITEWREKVIISNFDKKKLKSFMNLTYSAVYLKARNEWDLHDYPPKVGSKDVPIELDSKDFDKLTDFIKVQDRQKKARVTAVGATDQRGTVIYDRGKIKGGW